ncbi:hypothetical protein GCM10028786_08690 [Flaviaesturariibacter terrae]
MPRPDPIVVKLPVVVLSIRPEEELNVPPGEPFRVTYTRPSSAQNEVRPYEIEAVGQDWAATVSQRADAHISTSKGSRRFVVLAENFQRSA